MKRHVLRATLTPFAVLMLGVGHAPATEKSAARALVTEKCSTCPGDRGSSAASLFSPLASQQPQFIETQLKAFRDHGRADRCAPQYM